MLETVHPDGRRDEGGMGGPALYPGELLNVYTGRAGQGLLRVIVRADPRVRRLRCQSEMGESCGILPSGDDPCVGVVLCPLDSGGTVSVAHGAGRAPVSDDVAARLAEVAARVAARHEEPNPASAAAVATTRNKALEVLAAYGPQTIPGEPGNVPVYAVVMTGSLTSPRTAPPNPSRPVPRPVTGSCLLIVVEAATLQVRDVGVRHWDPGPALLRLGPVTRLALPPGRVGDPRDVARTVGFPLRPGGDFHTA